MKKIYELVWVDGEDIGEREKIIETAHEKKSMGYYSSYEKVMEVLLKRISGHNTKIEYINNYYEDCERIPTFLKDDKLKVVVAMYLNYYGKKDIEYLYNYYCVRELILQ